MEQLIKELLHRIEMPSFVTYIFKFSLIVLLPIYVVVQWMFF